MTHNQEHELDDIAIDAMAAFIIKGTLAEGDIPAAAYRMADAMLAEKQSRRERAIAARKAEPTSPPPIKKRTL